MHVDVDETLPRHAAPTHSMLRVVRINTWRKLQGNPSIRWGATRISCHRGAAIAMKPGTNDDMSSGPRRRGKEETRSMLLA